jgi:hypothetical protein
MPALITPEKLHRAMRRGFERVENFRKARYLFMKEYVGSFYDNADPATAQANPVNLIFKAVSILVPHLVAKNPEHDVDSRFAAFADYAEMLSLALDDLSRKIGSKATLRLSIIDAIFGMGIVRDGLEMSGDVLEDPHGMHTNVAQPYADRVDLDDFTLDPNCRDLRKAFMLGNRVRVTRTFLEESGLYNPDVAMGLPSAGDSYRKGKEVEQLSRRRDNDGEELLDEVDIVELYLPDDNVVVTLPFDEVPTGDFLRVVDYDGPRAYGDCPALGPYHFLGFHWVSNNPFPIAPCGIWYDLHEMANDHAAKANRQARRSKQVLVYGRSATDDAQEIVDADDGDSVAVDHPDAVKTVAYGGATEDIYAHLAWIDAKFSESGPGDFQQLGGEASMAETATQANILQQAATIRVGDMRDVVYDFAASIARSLAWHLHTDPLIEMPLSKRLPGGEQVTLWLTPEAQRGDFLDFHFEIKMESMARDNPMMRSQKLIQFVQTVVPTAIQTFLQLHAVGMGGMFNFIRFITINAKQQGIDNFEAVWNDPEFQVLVAEQMMKAPQLMQSMGVPMAGSEGPQPGGGSGDGPGVPRYQGAGLDPNANPMAALAQMGSAPVQSGDGNRSGRPGGGSPGM